MTEPIDSNPWLGGSGQSYVGAVITFTRNRDGTMDVSALPHTKTMNILLTCVAELVEQLEAAGRLGSCLADIGYAAKPIPCATCGVNRGVPGSGAFPHCKGGKCEGPDADGLLPHPKPCCGAWKQPAAQEKKP